MQQRRAKGMVRNYRRGGGLLCLGVGLSFFELGFREGLKFLGFS